MLNPLSPEQREIYVYIMDVYEPHPLGKGHYNPVPIIQDEHFYLEITMEVQEPHEWGRSFHVNQDTMDRLHMRSGLKMGDAYAIHVKFAPASVGTDWYTCLGNPSVAPLMANKQVVYGTRRTGPPPGVTIGP